MSSYTGCNWVAIISNWIKLRSTRIYIDSQAIDRSQRAWLTGDLTNQNADILRPAAIRHLARQLRPVSIEMHVKTG